MIDFLKKFERIVTAALVVLLAVVIVLALIDLVWLLIRDILKPPLFILDIGDLLEIFGLFLLVLIGLELLETIKAYYVEGRVELRVIFAVALIALGRKIIILEPEKYCGLTLIGIGVIILALVAGFFVVSARDLEFRRARRKIDTPGR
ncbi:phosphate-starvation-inducible E-like protein [Desulfopila sp. IMCC35006]|uniref:phosphate-starvation-inducible PsiE family protein n=1 Tax=Desulfopila sp. IMCC35006 TaxID=2569542 RepID=UPI0010ACC94A|nr:phosphate-starvation-inducible PsiE family protein [Desulfopila sp. IMCC35006]TKB28322.1 phosphate-starvation-inducible E-like protein [Desulfopila sp. IMCC35006]